MTVLLVDNAHAYMGMLRRFVVKEMGVPRSGYGSALMPKQDSNSHLIDKEATGDAPLT